MLFQIGSTIFGFTWKVYNLQKQKENGELKSWKKTLTSRLFIQAKIKLWKSPNIRTQRTGNCRPCERYVRSFLLCSDGLKFLETFVWYFPLPILLCLLVNRISMVFSTCERKIKKKKRDVDYSGVGNGYSWSKMEKQLHNEKKEHKTKHRIKKYAEQKMEEKINARGAKK